MFTSHNNYSENKLTHILNILTCKKSYRLTKRYLYFPSKPESRSIQSPFSH